MTPEQQAAFVNAKAAAALIKAMGMVAENQHRLACGNSVAFGEDSFNALIEEYGIHDNAMMVVFAPS